MNKRTTDAIIYDDEGHIIYRGEIKNGKPYGMGVEYYENGNKFRAGKFGIKGLLKGTEYYENGNIRYEGSYVLNRSYGPNIPVEGKFYNETGELIYSGKPLIRLGGVGYPMIIEPKDFGPACLNPKNHKLRYFMWEDMNSDVREDRPND